MTLSPRHSTRVGAIATAILLAASGVITVPTASAVTGATTRVMTSGRYHIELPDNGPRDVALGVPSDVMHDGTTSAGATGGNVGAEGTAFCGGGVTIALGQAFSGTAGGTADFGLLLAGADAGFENTPASITCPGIMPTPNSYAGNTFTTVTATFVDFITVGSASGLPAGTMKHLRFTAVIHAGVGGVGGKRARRPLHGQSHGRDRVAHREYGSSARPALRRRFHRAASRAKRSMSPSVRVSSTRAASPLVRQPSAALARARPPSLATPARSSIPTIPTSCSLAPAATTTARAPSPPPPPRRPARFRPARRSIS